MKQTKTAPETAPVLWRPTWAWHLKTLAVIYLLLTIVFFAVDHFLSRLPEPYRLRDIPPEMTPWLKK
ncbi:MAG: hypothetical protein IPP68_06430 [Elusimicrobia bacterium]|jgi:hypothetical protein|nr:hypothetical protein [Elusimicrobiota bacterium]